MYIYTCFIARTSLPESKNPKLHKLEEFTFTTVKKNVVQNATGTIIALTANLLKEETLMNWHTPTFKTPASMAYRPNRSRLTYEGLNHHPSLCKQTEQTSTSDHRNKNCFIIHSSIFILGRSMYLKRNIQNFLLPKKQPQNTPPFRNKISVSSLFSKDKKRQPEEEVINYEI
ncbi:hypothetical protein, no similarity [Maudiozyma barnettii]|uniref:Uncharacterized protein n=1 Tax=Maudiozyma barnettii TaxID=61262 RepID=A0A8H2VKS0_9SACH|nr:hypothetical protein, no similarity [Kazachstania barnettii]CAB4257217.1 hypothetical protein, no similarity [Kazachstania barnettii]CAD1779587.1 hypothetical protein, no similarity [Kazachstania barnettii]